VRAHLVTYDGTSFVARADLSLGRALEALERAQLAQRAQRAQLAQRLAQRAQRARARGGGPAGSTWSASTTSRPCARPAGPWGCTR
jgi:type II secretory pathway pseudopilin PulG